MSRLTRWLSGLSVVCGFGLLAATSSGGSLEDLKARGRAASAPEEALEAARALRRAGLLADALSTTQRAFAKARGNDPIAELRLDLARTYIEQRQQKRALHECDQIHKLSPFKEQICIAEAQLLTRRGSAALPAAEQALTLVPSDYDALVAKGRALTQLGQPVQAETTLRQAVTRAPNRAEAFRYLAELLIAQGKPAEAATVLREGRRAVPDDPDVLALLGATLPPGKEARDVLEQALANRPGFAVAEARLGQVLAAQGDLDGAERRLTAALAVSPRQADWHASLGEVQVAKKQPDLALKSAHAALQIVANHGPAKLVEAKALAAKGDIDLAIEAFQAAYGFSKADPGALLDAARACIKGGRLTTAKAFADRATEDFPKSGLAWETEGDVALALKDAAFARQAYAKALAGEGAVDKDGIRRKLASLK